MKKVGLVIVHYGDRTITIYSLKTFSSALLKLLSTRRDIIAYVLIIDNMGNLDPDEVGKTFELLKDFAGNRFHIQVYKPSNNLGYAGGCKLGIHYLINKKSVDYIICSNNDIFPHKESLSKLLEIAEALRYRMGLIQPLVLRAVVQDGKVILTRYLDSLGLICDYALGGCFDYSNWPLRAPIKHYKRANIKLALLEVPIVNGMFFFTSSYNWIRSRGIDPEFFMFNEDVLLSLSMLALGLRNYVAINSIVFHIRGGAAKGIFIKRNPMHSSYYTARNSLLTLIYLYDFPYLITSLFSNIIVRILKVLFLTLKYRTSLHLYYFLCALFYMIKKTKRMSRIRGLLPKLASKHIKQLIREGKMLTPSDTLKLLISYRKRFKI